MNTYSVYIHIAPNNKKYIGVTKNSPELRWRNGTGYSKSLLGRAIKKYGWGNISHGIFAQGLSLEEAAQMEQALISFWHTLYQENGYNICAGGHISNPCLTEEEKEKIREKKRGANNVKSKPIRCIQNGITYESVGEASRLLEIGKTGILRVLKGRNNHTGGYSFEYVRDCDKKDKIKTMSKEECANLFKKKVAVYSLDGELIKVCESRVDAAKTFGISAQVVCNCINNYRNRCGNYLFKDASDEIYSKIEKAIIKDFSGRNNPSARAIDCYTNKGEFIKHYDYAKSAAEELGCDLSTIIKVCRGKAKTHKGYIFKYSNLNAWEEQL